MKRMTMMTAAALAALTATAAMRPTPEYLKKAVVYQVVLRNFTRDGNFKAATKMLDHVRSAGVDVVYLAPFVEMDCDMDESGWSPRQIKSGFGSPKNAYRISNYDKIDPEYGKDEDFKAFNDRAHALGMKVYMDLVYLHCGPSNVIKDLFPDAFQTTNGVVRTTYWRFPYVNFGSRQVRKYLIDSMLHWMRLGCDGFRCDVGDQVPIDFWVEAATACQKVNSELVMINEGTKEEWLEKAFDACYAWPWSFTVRGLLTPNARAHGHAKGKSLPEKMAHVRAYEKKVPADALMFCFMDNHDTATDDWDDRFDRIRPVEAGNAAFVLTFLRRGLPLVFNGNEIADNARNSFFGPVEHPARAYKTIDWARAVQPDGQSRLSLIRRLAKMRHEDPIWSDGSMEWVTDGERNGVIAFTRTLGARKVLVAANLSDKEADGGALVGKLGPYAYVIRELSAVEGLVQMPPACTTPDGMCVDPQGRLVIAAPNNSCKQPGAVFRLSAPGGVPEKWFDVPALPETGYSQPMGVCFGDDGALYVCDCNAKGKGRLLRFTFAGDRVAACETVAEGLHNANGVKCRKGKLYVTQAFLYDIPRGDGAATSGLYMFDVKDRNVRVGNAPSDPQCVFADVTRNPKVKCGLNGVAIDSRGVLYTGNYGDGRIWKLRLGDDGRVASAEEFVPASAGVKTPDGLCVDEADNLYVADMQGDAAVKVSPAGEVTFVRRGGFSRPSEPCVWRGRLYVANYGATTLAEIPQSR